MQLEHSAMTHGQAGVVASLATWAARRRRLAAKNTHSLR